MAYTGPPYVSNYDPPSLWYLLGEDSTTQEWVEDFSLPMEIVTTPGNAGQFGDIDIYNIKQPTRLVSLQGEGFTDQDSGLFCYAAQQADARVTVTTVDGKTYSGLVKSCHRTAKLYWVTDVSDIRYQISLTLRIPMPSAI